MFILTVYYPVDVSTETSHCTQWIHMIFICEIKIISYKRHKKLQLCLGKRKNSYVPHNGAYVNNGLSNWVQCQVAAMQQAVHPCLSTHCDVCTIMKFSGRISATKAVWSICVGLYRIVTSPLVTSFFMSLSMLGICWFEIIPIIQGETKYMLRNWKHKWQCQTWSHLMTRTTSLYHGLNAAVPGLTGPDLQSTCNRLPCQFQDNTSISKLCICRSSSPTMYPAAC